MYTVVFMGKEGFIFLPWLLRDCRLRHCLQRLEIANCADAAAQISFLGPLPSASRGDPLSSSILARPPQLPPLPPSFRLVRNESRFSLASLPSINLSWLPAERAGLHPKCERERGALASFSRWGGGCSSVCQTCSRTYVRTTCMEKGGRTKKPLWYARLIAQSLIAVRLPYRPTTRGIFLPRAPLAVIPQLLFWLAVAQKARAIGTSTTDPTLAKPPFSRKCANAHSPRPFLRGKKNLQ